MVFKSLSIFFTRKYLNKTVCLNANYALHTKKLTTRLFTLHVILKELNMRSGQNIHRVGLLIPLYFLSHCTLYAVLCILHTAPYALHSKVCTLYTNTLHSAQCTLGTLYEYCKLK